MKHLASPRFWRHYRQLPEAVRKLADKNFQLLKADPHHPSLHLKKVDQLWSVRRRRSLSSLARIKARVAQGGHDVASGVVRRRFESGLRNFRDVYMHLVDRWEWYDNSGTTPQLISEGGNWK